MDTGFLQGGMSTWVYRGGMILTKVLVSDKSIFFFNLSTNTFILTEKVDVFSIPLMGTYCRNTSKQVCYMN